MSLKLTGNNVSSLKALHKEPPEDPENEEEQVTYWPVLQSLNLQNNNIKELPKLNCPNLRYLDLSDNKIYTISEEFEGHERLLELDLNANSLHKIDRLVNMPELKILKLSNNKIREFLGLDGCTSLVRLDLRANQVKNILKFF